MATHPTHHMLIVEDNPDHFEIMQRLIKKSGAAVEITWLQDGQECLEYLNCLEQRVEDLDEPLPELAVLDLRLPGADGITVLQRIKSSPFLHLMVTVIFTSSSHIRDVTAAYRNNANSYLVKPSDLNSFSELVVMLQNYWLNFNQPPVSR